MSYNALRATPRGRAALAGAVSAVALASAVLIKPWEGRRLVSYQDVVGVWTACDGETKGIGPGMKFTPAQCDKMLRDRVAKDFEAPLRVCIKGFDLMPISVRASFISLAYNVGTGAVCKSTAARHAELGNYPAACEMATGFNRAGKRVWPGLVARREMGDAHRIGEAELCYSGL